MDNKLKLLAIIVVAFLGMPHLSFNGWANDSEEMKIVDGGYVPKEGFVPDEATAKLIARAVLTKIYGQKQIDCEKPFRAELKDGVWTVKGYLPKDVAGGVAILKLSKSDGRVLYVYHGK